MQLIHPAPRHCSIAKSLAGKAVGFLSTAILFIATTVVIAFGQHPAKNSLPGQSIESNGESAIESSVDVTTLVRKSDANGSLMHRKLLEYTYTLRKTRRALVGRGKVAREIDETFEAYPIKGQHVLIQLTRNGKPLLGLEVSEARRRAGEELLKAERAAQKQKAGKSAQPEEADSYIKAGIVINDKGKSAALSIDISEFLRSCDFSSPRMERVGDREMIALDFKPRPGVEFIYVKRFMSKLVGTIWIDAEDKVVARLEGHVPPQGDAGEPESTLLYEQARNGSGLWFPRAIRLASGDGLLLNGLQWEITLEFSDYKQFSSTVEEVKIKEPKDQ